MKQIKAIITVLSIFAILFFVAIFSTGCTNKKVNLGKIVLKETFCTDINECKKALNKECSDKVNIVNTRKPFTIQYYCEQSYE